MAFEQPDYSVKKKYPDFEIREYKSYLVAETIVSGDFENATNSAFSILFRYISGANTGSQKIRMTVPVNQQNAADRGEKIKMTVPVISRRGEKEADMYNLAFVVPSKYTLENVPRPSDPRVQIRRIPGRHMAVIRYSGNWKQKNYLKHEAILFQALEREGLQPLGDPVYARYNPPFWPNFLNRNEILIEVNFP